MEPERTADRSAVATPVVFSRVGGLTIHAATGPNWRRAAFELADVLSEHIFREETDLSPAAHQLLSPALWDAVDAASETPHMMEDR